MRGGGWVGGVVGGGGGGWGGVGALARLPSVTEILLDGGKDITTATAPSSWKLSFSLAAEMLLITCIPAGIGRGLAGGVSEGLRTV